MSWQPTSRRAISSRSRSFNEDRSLLHNTQTLAEDQAQFLLQAGKRGVPAGGWPEGSYHAKVTITRDGKTLVEQSSKPIAFE